MSTRYETRVEIRARPGPCYWLSAAGTHAAALAVLWAVPAPARFPAGLLIAVSALITWRGRCRAAWLIWSGYGSVRLVGPGGEERFCDVLTAPYRTPSLVVLSVRSGRQVWRIPVFRREQPEAVRRLNQRLLAGRPPNPDPLSDDRHV